MVESFLALVLPLFDSRAQTRPFNLSKSLYGYYGMELRDFQLIKSSFQVLQKDLMENRK